MKFPFASAAGTLRLLPSSALIFKEDGPSVAIVGANNRVVIRRVTVGRDEGAQIEVTSGLNGSEKVVDTPPDALVTGDQVRVESGRAAS